MLKRELKINLKGLILWTVILIAVFIIVFAIYPSLMNDQTIESLKEMMKSMPQEMLASFNMDIIGIETAFGWFKTEGYIFLVLVGGLYAAILGSTILLKEETEKTIEFLYSKPVSRNKIVTSKIFSGVINILVFTVFVTLANYIGLIVNEALDVKQFLMISIIPMLLYYMLFFICLFISTFLKKTKKSMSIGIALVFISYLLQIIGNMGESAEIFKKISLFEFASSRYIILNDAFDMKYVVIGIVIIILTIFGTYKVYNKKELI